MKKTLTSSKVLIVLLVIAVCIGVAGCGKEEAKEDNKKVINMEEHAKAAKKEKIKQNAQEKDEQDEVPLEKKLEKKLLKSATGEIVGSTTLFKAPSSISNEEIQEWYDVVKDNGSNCNFIQYYDKPNLGIYQVKGMIEKDIPIAFDEHKAPYMDGNGTVFIETEDGKLNFDN